MYLLCVKGRSLSVWVLLKRHTDAVRLKLAGLRGDEIVRCCGWCSRCENCWMSLEDEDDDV